MNSDAFKDRLKAVMGKESNRSFAEKCGISEGTVRRYLKGEAFPPLDTLQVMASKSGSSLAWLASGEGEMKRTARRGHDGHAAMITLGGLYPSLNKGPQPTVNDTKGVYGVEYSPEVAELAALLENYAGKALKADLKAKLLKVKEMFEDN